MEGLASAVIVTDPPLLIDDIASRVTPAVVVVLPVAEPTPGRSALGANPGPPSPSVVSTYFETSAELLTLLVVVLVIATSPPAIRLLSLIWMELEAFDRPTLTAKLGTQLKVMAPIKFSPLIVVTDASRTLLAFDVICSELLAPLACRMLLVIAMASSLEEMAMSNGIK